MVFQETSLVPSMTVAQNLYLGQEKFLNRLRGIYISAQQFLQSLNFTVDPTAIVATLGAAKRQMVEIARAVHHKAEVIIFDEPTATLTPEEKRHFFALMRRLKQRGVSIVFITHALEEALAHCRPHHHPARRREGADRPDRELRPRQVIRAMVGRTLSDELYRNRRGAADVRKAGKKILSVQDISMGNIVRNNSFSVYEGQITGVFGLIGSGRTETFKVVSGIYKRNFLRGGDIELDGKPVRYYVPAPAVKDGIVYVTEDRKAEGFFETMSIAENLYSGLLAAGLEQLPYVSMREMRELSQHWSKSLNVRAINDNARVVELSRRQPAEGGDRQGPGAEAEAGHLRRADPRRRCRRDRGNPPAHQQAGRRRPRRRRDLLLPAGDHEPLRPHPGLPPGPHRGRAVAPGRDRGKDHVRRGALINRPSPD